jgi:hypothetical protein
MLNMGTLEIRGISTKIATNSKYMHVPGSQHIAKSLNPSLSHPTLSLLPRFRRLIPMRLLIIVRIHLHRTCKCRRLVYPRLLHLRIFIGRWRVRLCDVWLRRVRLALIWCLRLITVALVWVASLRIRVCLCAAPSSSPDEKAYCANECKPAYHAAYNAAYGTTGESAVVVVRSWSG